MDADPKSPPQIGTPSAFHATACSSFAGKLLERLERAPSGSATAGEICGGKKRIAAESALRAMERRGLVGRFFHPKDTIWSNTYWFKIDKTNADVMAAADNKTPTKETTL